MVSPIAGGTVVYRTSEADKLFDYARRGELGTLVREADQFRIDAHEAALAAAHREEMTAVGALPDHATPGADRSVLAIGGRRQRSAPSAP